MLIQTKLNRPPLPVDMVHRPRLTKWLKRHQRRPLTLITAPAGDGKSTYREDVLDAYLFRSIDEVKSFTNDWLEEYNGIRPHQALDDVPPFQFGSDSP